MARPSPSASSQSSSPPVEPKLPEGLTATGADDARREPDWAQVDVEGDLAGLVAPNLDMFESRVLRSQLTGANLTGARLTDVAFEDCELSGAILQDAGFTRVAFRRCRMSGVMLAGARLHDVQFVDCKLDRADLRMTTGERVQFDNSLLPEADFEAAKLQSLRCFDCDLTSASFVQAQVPSARLHGSKVDGVRGAQFLKRAVIGTEQLVPFALRVFADLGVVVDDEREPPKSRDRSR